LKAPAFAYAKPATLREVFELLQHHGDGAKILAGGQSLLASLNLRLSSPELLIDITGLQGLTGIRVEDGRVRIGALTTHRAIEQSPEIAEHLPLLAQAVRHVAHVAIRNVGTIGGSFALADPAAEYPACAVALDATVVLADREGERRVKAREFFRGLYETALAPDEVLAAVEFEAIQPGYRSVFLELACRQGDYAIVGLAAHAKVDGRRFSDVRLAFLGAGGTPVLATKAMASLERKSFGADVVAAAKQALGEDLDPPKDLTTSSAAKLHLARVLTGRALAALSQ
jgi:carbon-monoxide dehydrogenase medium subunit